jgi:hypothetical protein
MNDRLRDRIAAVQAQHHHWDYAGALTCACGEDFGLSDNGWEAAVQEWAAHVADAVMKLGLRQETVEDWHGKVGRSYGTTS